LTQGAPRVEPRRPRYRKAELVALALALPLRLGGGRSRNGGSAEDALAQTEAAGAAQRADHPCGLALGCRGLLGFVDRNDPLDASTEPRLQPDGRSRVRDRAQDVDALQILLADQELGEPLERFDVLGEKLESVLVCGVNELLDDPVDEAERLLRQLTAVVEADDLADLG
jgi:hypothetical protein